MDEEAITNLLNVVKHIERCRVSDQRSSVECAANDERAHMTRYYAGRSDGHQFAGSILRNMLLSMGVAIPEDV